MERLYAEWEYREPLSVNIEAGGKEYILRDLKEMLEECGVM